MLVWIKLILNWELLISMDLHINIIIKLGTACVYQTALISAIKLEIN